MIAPPKPPSHDELEALIKEARQRQLRRRLLGATVVAIATVLGFGVYAIATGGSGRGNSGRLSAGGPPPCRPSQLSSAAGLNGAVGTLDGTVLLTNTSSSTCSFPTGRPHVSVLWRGHVLPTREIANGQPSKRFGGLLAQHSTVAIDMFWSNSCGRLSHSTADPTFRFSWAGQLTVDVPNGLTAPPPRCNGKGGPSVISVDRPYRNALLTG